MKKLTFSLAGLLIISVITTNIFASSLFVGNSNSNSNKLHNLDHGDCRNYVNLMSDKNKVYFNSESEGIAAGYHPCDKCNSGSTPDPQPAEPKPTALTIKSENKFYSNNEITISGQLTYASYGYNLGLSSKNIAINKIEGNQPIAVLTTDIIGYYYFSFIPNATYNYQASFTGDSSYLASLSPIITIIPRAISKTPEPTLEPEPEPEPAKKKIRVANNFHKKKCKKDRKYHAKHCKTKSKHKKKCTKVISK